MKTWAMLREEGTWAAAKVTYKGARSNVDPLVRQLGELLRDDAGFLLDICKRAGVHRSTLRRWFSGERTPNLLDFKAVLEVSGYTLTIRKSDDRDPE